MLQNNLNIRFQSSYLHIVYLKYHLVPENYSYIHGWSVVDTPYVLYTEDY